MTQTNRNEQTPTYVCHAALIIEGDTYVCHAASHANLDMCVVSSRKYYLPPMMCVRPRPSTKILRGGWLDAARYIPYV